MAYQKGSLKLEGKIGNLSFYQSKEKHLVRQNSGLSAKRVEKDPKFVRTRENNREFGQASNAAKQIRMAVRQALGELFVIFDDPSVVNRLNKRMLGIIKADPQGDRGKRRITPENLKLLYGFSFNAAAPLQEVLYVPPVVSYQPETGLLKMGIPAIFPPSAMDIPGEAVFFRFHAIALLFNEGTERLPWVAGHSEWYATNPVLTSPDAIELHLPAGSPDALIIGFGVSFYQKIGGFPTPVLAPSRNGLDIVQVLV